jgi:hypothetical protein
MQVANKHSMGRNRYCDSQEEIFKHLKIDRRLSKGFISDGAVKKSYRIVDGIERYPQDKQREQAVYQMTIPNR